MEGGLIGSSVQSPARMLIKDGTMTVLVEWDSAYYEYMLVENVKIPVEQREGNSKFKFLVYKTDTPMTVTVCRNDLGTKALADCTLVFDSSGIEKASGGVSKNYAMASAGLSFFGVIAIAALALFFLHRRMKAYV